MKKQRQGERRTFRFWGKISKERVKVQFILQQSYLRILDNLEFGKNYVSFVLCYTFQKCKGNKETRGSGNGLRSETPAKKKKYPHMLHTLSLGLKTQELEYLFEKPCSASLVY